MKFGDHLRIHLQCLAGIHYNPVVEGKDYSVPMLLQRSGVIPEEPQPASRMPDLVEEYSESELAVDMNILENSEPFAPWCSIHGRTHVASAIVVINGKNCCALIDTGAQISCMAMDVFHTANYVLDTTKLFVIRGLGPSKSSTYGSVEAEVAFLNTNVRQCFAVVDNSTMPFCLILGADFIVTTGMELNFKTLTCSSDGVSISLDRPGHRSAAHVTHNGIMVEELSYQIPRTVTGICVGVSDQQLTFAIDTFDACDVPVLSGLIDRDEILTLQRHDRIIKTLRRHLQQPDVGNWPIALSRYRRYAPSLAIVDGIVVFLHPDRRPVPLVSFPLLVEVMLVVHHKMAHPGRQKLLSMILEHIWHPSTAKVAADVTRTCDACQRVKVSPTIQPPVTKIHTHSPFELVAVDLIALSTTSSGKVGCLVLVDHNSKWLSVVPLTSKRASAVVDAMHHRVLPSLPRVPKKLLSDNGVEFRCAAFNSLLDECGIEHIYTTPYKPASNGLVERTNRTLTELLRNMGSSNEAWDKLIPKVVMTYNTTFHAQLKMFPSRYLLTQKHLTDNMPMIPAADVAHWREGNPSFVPYKVGQKV